MSPSTLFRKYYFQFLVRGVEVLLCVLKNILKGWGVG
jgi:hypothetical protein